MKEITIKIEILDFWHAGTGRGMGIVADASPIKTKAGLPYLPGKTFRGLLREGIQTAEDIGHEDVPVSTTQFIFGDSPIEEERKQGIIRITDAVIPGGLEEYLLSLGPKGKTLAETLFFKISATAISNETSVAKPHSLHVFEVAVPLELRSKVFIKEEHFDKVKKAIKAGLPFIRGLGVKRRRGLGRAIFSVVE